MSAVSIHRAAAPAVLCGVIDGVVVMAEIPPIDVVNESVPVVVDSVA
jgi:hypothetical protein